MADASPDDPQSYLLSEAESRAIFEREIIPAELGAIQQATASEAGQRRGSDPRRQPVAVFVVGQIGAGKTRTGPVIRQALEASWHSRAGGQGDDEDEARDESERDREAGTGREKRPRMQPLIAHLIADTYKVYHPRHAALVSSSSSSSSTAFASAATAPDARRWLARAVAWALARGADVLVEAACRAPGDVAALVHACATAGHRVEVALLAVPAGLSRLGVLARYHLHQQHEHRQGHHRCGEETETGTTTYRRGSGPSSSSSGGEGEGNERDDDGEDGAGAEQKVRGRGAALLPPRLTPAAVHDASYAGLLEVARFVDGDGGPYGGAVDQVVLVRRAGLVAYANERRPHPEQGGAGAGSWMHPPGAATALLRERERHLTARERALAEEDLRRLRVVAGELGQEAGGARLTAQLDKVEALLRPLMDARRETNEASMRPWVLPGLGEEDEQFNGIADLRLGFEPS